MATKRKPVKLKCIGRVDTQRTIGWYVRIQFNGVLRARKLFSDKIWGGKAKALAAAIEFRDAAEDAIGKARTNRRVTTLARAGQPMRGVSETDLAWIASVVTAKGVLLRRSFSKSKYGPLAARNQAIAVREAWNRGEIEK